MGDASDTYTHRHLKKKVGGPARWRSRSLWARGESVLSSLSLCPHTISLPLCEQYRPMSMLERGASTFFLEVTACTAIKHLSKLAYLFAFPVSASRLHARQDCQACWSSRQIEYLEFSSLSGLRKGSGSQILVRPFE